MKGFFLCLLALSLVWLSSAPLRAEEDYLIGAEDILEIIVWGHDDLHRVMPVSFEGMISFPLIGEIRASGVVAGALEKVIAAKLGEGFIVDPQVMVTVKEYKSQRVFLMGEVNKPGKYSFERGTTVLMAISIGGGLTPKAAPNRTKIVREQDGRKVEVLTGMDALVLPGDTIIVPESFF